ncbi:hypothetical protein Tco_1210860 [Tanacetum coccineum]
MHSSLLTPQDEPIIVTDESEKDEADKGDTHDTSHDVPEDTSIPPPTSLKSAQIQEPYYPNINQLFDLLVTSLKLELSKLLAPHNFASCLPTDLKELPPKFTELSGEIKELKQHVKDMEIELPGDLKKIPTKLETFTSTICGLTSQLELLKLLQRQLFRSLEDWEVSSLQVDSTTKTKRLQPRNSTKNDRLAIRNDKFEVVCAMCKQYLITANYDVCALNYVNDINSHADNQNANVINISNQKKHQGKVKKSKKLGSDERLASPRPRKPRTHLRWSPTRTTFDLSGKVIPSSESECQSDIFESDNACASNHQEPTSKRFPNSTSFLGRLSKYKFMGTVRFGIDHVATILGYGDLQWGNILIARVYFVEGLGHNLFFVGQFCDSDLEVAFKRNICFVRNLEGVDLLKGNHTTNLYTINLHEMATASPICLMARATSTKS